MFQYVIAGLVLGGIYAIAATGLVVTFLSAGILNLSFAAMAYTVARFYYYLNSQLNWGIVPSAILSIVVLGPALGIFFYFLLFRRLHQTSTLVKILVTLGLSVALPSLDTVIFGTEAIVAAPGLAPEPVHVYHLAGVPVTLDQVIVYCCVLAVVVLGVVVLRYTDVGLRVRAMVDSPAMTSISGTNPQRVSMWVWAVSVGLAGLTGVLSAPIIGLDRGTSRCSWWPPCPPSSRPSCGAFRSPSSWGWPWVLPERWCSMRFPPTARSPRRCCLPSPSSPPRSSSSTS